MKNQENTVPNTENFWSPEEIEFYLATRNFLDNPQDEEAREKFIAMLNLRKGNRKPKE